MKESTAAGWGLAVGAAALAVALVTLGILIAQERRTKKYRPRPDWVIRRIGPATLTRDGAAETWEAFEVVNAGTANASIVDARIVGAEQRYEDGFVIPGVLVAGASARVLVGDTFEEAWIRITYHHPYRSGATVMWRPMVVGSDLSDVLTQQIGALASPWWRPWSKSDLPGFVGPGGRPSVRIPARKKDEMAELVSAALAHPDA